jgi:hypothetical protein
MVTYPLDLAAFKDPNYGEYLREAVIKRLRTPGLYREDILQELEDIRCFLAEERLEEVEETVMAVMDQIVGWCRLDQSLKALGEPRPSASLANANRRPSRTVTPG